MGIFNTDEKELGMLSKEKIVEAVHNAGVAVELPLEMPTDEKFDDLGMDSLDIFNIFVELETMTGHQVPDSEIESLQTVDAIHEYFQSMEG